MVGEIWSKAEKKAARKIFDEAFERENHLIIEKIRELASKAASYEDILAIRKYTNSSIKSLNQTYDYRYSRLIDVFAVLLATGMISENSLNSFSRDKADMIRSMAGIRSKLR